MITSIFIFKADLVPPNDQYILVRQLFWGGRRGGINSKYEQLRKKANMEFYIRKCMPFTYFQMTIWKSKGIKCLAQDFRASL